MADGPICKGNHSSHLCALAEEGSVRIKELTEEPKFKCDNCGRTAKSVSNLCNPVDLEDLPAGESGSL